MTFKALVLHEKDKGVEARIEQLDDSALPAGDVLVDVAWSGLNYKDGLILNGLGRLVRQYPHVPGIDLAGTVSASDNPAYKAGDPVVLTGWRVGETHWGGYAQRARVNAGWLTPLPAGLTARQAMAVGTAGFTAMMAVAALEEHGLTPERGEVLVTGAAGGLGSIAVNLLAKLGYRVVASSGRPETADYLHRLGAAEVIGREAVLNSSGKPLNSERWAGVVDSVGGDTLAGVLSSLRHGASIAVCGNAGGVPFSSTVLPFLLRGNNLLGIDSVLCPPDRRVTLWQRIASTLSLDLLEDVVETAGLDDLPALGAKILKGGVRGRVVVDLAK